MDLGWSDFTPVGYLKVVPAAVADYVEANGLQGKMRSNLFVGAEIEGRWASLKITDKRWPCHTGKAIQKGATKTSCAWRQAPLPLCPRTSATASTPR